MVKFLLILNLFLLSCSPNIYKNYQFKPDCKLKISLLGDTIDSKDFFTFYVTNENNYEINLSDLSCETNTSVNIYNSKNNQIPHFVLIHPILSCGERFIKIEPGKSVPVVCSYSLQKMFNVLPEMNYFIKINCKSFVKINNKKYICPDLTLEKVITIK